MSDNWTSQTSGVSTSISLVRFGNGVFLGHTFGADNKSHVIRSTNSGVTWANITVTLTNHVLRDLSYGSGVWIGVGLILGPGTAVIYRSTDDGLTWTQITGLPAGFGGGVGGATPNSVVFQSGTWVVTTFGTHTGVNNYIVSSDGGLTWSLPGTFTCDTFFAESLTVDGISFISPCIVAGVNKIASSPDGHTWSVVNAPPDINTTGPVAFGSGNYISLNLSTVTVRVSAILSGLATASDTATNTISNPVWTGFGGGNFIVVDSSGGVARSSDTGVTWVAGVLNFPVSNAASGVAFGGGVWVAAGDNGHISTLNLVLPIPPPVLNVPATLPVATQGFPFKYQVVVTGGLPPYTFSISVFPNTDSWMTIDPVIGLISGTPPIGGTETIVFIQVIDHAGNIVQVGPFTFKIVDVTNALSYENLITSEHNQKPKFMQLVTTLTAAVGDVTSVTQALVPAFSLETAIGAQLDVLGLWIGQSRKIDNVLVVGFFGFSEVSTGVPDGLQEPFGELSNPSIGGVWYNLGQSASGSTILNDQAYLTILKAKIVKNQWNGTISGMEQALQFIVGVACSIADTGNLNLSINVPLPITPLEQALLTSLDLVPRPAGVRINSITFIP